jgi:protein-disulfide isomerase
LSAKTLARSLRLVVLLGLACAIAAYALGYVRMAWQERGIVAHAEEIFRSPTSFVTGNPQGDVSVVAFLDYNCPYCRQGAPDLAKLIEQDTEVRLVLKELPVLGKDQLEQLIVGDTIGAGIAEAAP